MVGDRDPAGRDGAGRLGYRIDSGKNGEQFARFCVGKHGKSPKIYVDSCQAAGQRAASWMNGDMVLLPLAGEMGATIFD